jgi:hypothetical protein
MNYLIANLEVVAFMIVAFALYHYYVSAAKESFIENSELHEKLIADKLSIIEHFSSCDTKSELISSELQIDSFQWYWSEKVSNELVDHIVKNELYPAFYKRLKFFNVPNFTAN